MNFKEKKNLNGFQQFFKCMLCHFSFTSAIAQSFALQLVLPRVMRIKALKH